SNTTAGIQVWSGDNTTVRRNKAALGWAASPVRARLVLNINGAGDVECASTKDSSGWQAASSAALKAGIMPLDEEDLCNLFDVLRDLHLYRYVRQDDVEDKLEYGVIAEEAHVELLGSLEITMV